MRTGWLTEKSPNFIYKDSHHKYTIQSIPLMSYIANKTMDELYYMTLAIRMNDPSDTTTINEIV